MFNEVRKLLRDKNIEMDDIGKTSSFLLKHQFIYRKNNRHSNHYLLIEENSKIFQDAFDLFNLKLVIDHDYGYIGYLPKEDNNYKINIAQSAVLLVLRLIYHQERKLGNSENGQVVISGSQFTVMYKDLTNRDDIDKNKATLDSSLKPVRDKGLIYLSREVDAETGLPNITILPPIEIVVDNAFAEAVTKEIQSNEVEEELDEIN